MAYMGDVYGVVVDSFCTSWVAWGLSFRAYTVPRDTEGGNYRALSVFLQLVSSCTLAVVWGAEFCFVVPIGSTSQCGGSVSCDC